MAKQLNFSKIVNAVWKKRDKRYGEKSSYLPPICLMRFAVEEGSEFYDAYHRMDDGIKRTSDKKTDMYAEFDDFVFMLISSLGRDVKIKKLNLRERSPKKMAGTVDRMIYFTMAAIMAQPENSEVISEKAGSYIMSALAEAENMPGFSFEAFIKGL